MTLARQRDRGRWGDAGERGRATLRQEQHPARARGPSALKAVFRGARGRAPSGPHNSNVLAKGRR